MKQYSFEPQGICPKMISFSLDDENKLHDVSFMGGCPGNTKAIGKLIEGEDAKRIADILRGNPCGGRGTSCADQLARGIDEALSGKTA